jgi:transposase InsO family protein
MSRRANCWDNAPMESCFASLKKELVHDEDYATRAEARASLFEYIEVFYNRVRRHSSLGYKSPAEYERAGDHGPGLREESQPRALSLPHPGEAGNLGRSRTLE